MLGNDFGHTNRTWLGSWFIVKGTWVPFGLVPLFSCVTGSALPGVSLLGRSLGAGNN